MSDENFLLVSLKEDEAKKLAQVISNDTSRKILDMLANRKDATESEIAKKMKLPLSTVHYNLQALLKARLVQADEFHYSEKGKEVNHYSLANKYVIIAPKDAPSNLAARLKRILPVALIVGAGALALQLFTMLQTGPELLTKAIPMDTDSAAESTRNAVAYDAIKQTGASAVEETEQAVAPLVHSAADNMTQVPQRIMESEPNLALWFALGALFAIVVFIVIDYIHRRK